MVVVVVAISVNHSGGHHCHQPQARLRPCQQQPPQNPSRPRPRSRSARGFLSPWLLVVVVATGLHTPARTLRSPRRPRRHGRRRRPGRHGPGTRRGAGRGPVPPPQGARRGGDPSAVPAGVPALPARRTLRASAASPQSGGCMGRTYQWRRSGGTGVTPAAKKSTLARTLHRYGRTTRPDDTPAQAWPGTPLPAVPPPCCAPARASCGAPCPMASALPTVRWTP
jgi:hypothetical protein